MALRATVLNGAVVEPVETTLATFTGGGGRFRVVSLFAPRAGMTVLVALLGDVAVAAAGYHSASSGPDPVATGFTDSGVMYDALAERLRHWINEAGVAPESIGVLVLTNREGERLVQELAERGVAARFVAGDKAPRGDQPLVMTMHRSKGMEFGNASEGMPRQGCGGASR